MVLPSEDYRYSIQPVPAAPDPDVFPPRELRDGDVSVLTSYISDVWAERNRSHDSIRRLGLTSLLTHLAAFEGSDWQARWLNSGLDEYNNPARFLGVSTHASGNITNALGALCALRVIRPSLPAFRSNFFVRYEQIFQVAEADPEFDRFCLLVDALARSPHYAQKARLDVAIALTTQQIHINSLTPEALMSYSRTCRDGGLGSYRHNNFIGHTAWTALHTGGFFNPSTPATLTAALRAPQLSPELMVKSYKLKNHDVAEMFAAYLRRRSYDVTYATVRALTIKLCRVFWREIEAINPSQSDLHLSEETYQAWRASLATNPDGSARKQIAGPLTAVRGLYLDIQGWAASEPETWARWAAPCPISLHDMKNLNRERRRTKERMDDRIRRLQPHLHTLVKAATEEHEWSAGLLEHAEAASRDELFEYSGRTYRRDIPVNESAFKAKHGFANIRVRDEQSGTQINVQKVEDNAFWCWAVMEVLRHTGARAEEVLELTQLSLRQYVRPNGEVIALLVIAPSKTDRERVIPMSAELFHVVAVIIRRLTKAHGGVIPMATNYTKDSRITSEPQPFLFQRRYGERDHTMTAGAMRSLLTGLKTRITQKHPEFATIDISPHDFRRLLATELANSGLPIHIGAALLGHVNLQTFHGYVTVFNEDVVKHYQDHLAKRRALRPAKEYRAATNDEWDEFAQHFDKRKVELGQCGRPYGTPCNHEHACVRCPMLRVDPKMLPRLDELEQDLEQRRIVAQRQGWLGEMEGIELTLRFLREKRNEASVLNSKPVLTIARRPPVS